MNKVNLYFSLLLSFLILSSLYLIIVNHSGVLFWDEWDLYAGWTIVAQAPLDQLFSKHNEHIAAFPKIINLVDFKLGATLIIGKVLTVLFLFYFATLYSRQDTDSSSTFKFLLFAVILACELNWLNRENLIWANQFGFLLGILGPLVGLRLFAFEGARRRNEDKIDAFSLLGILFFLTSITSVVSATIMLPIILIYLIWKKLFRHSILIACLIVSFVIIYGTGVSPPAHHPDRFDITSTSVNEILNLSKYIFILVNRAFVETTFIPLLLKVSLLSVLLTLILSKILNSKARQRTRIFHPEFICSVIYLLGVAGAIAVARFNFGTETAFTSRYAVIGLTMLAIFSVHLIKNFPEVKLEVLLGLMLLIAPIQLKYFHDDPNRVFTHRASIAGLYAGIYNSDYTSGIYYQKLPAECMLDQNSPKCMDSNFVQKIQEANFHQVGFFNNLNSRAPHLKSVAQKAPRINSNNLVIDTKLSDGCTGFVDHSKIIGNVLVLRGWISTYYRPFPNSIFDENLGGVMVRGQWRPDVAEARGRKNLHSGFEILVAISNLLQKDAIFQVYKDCSVTIHINRE